MLDLSGFGACIVQESPNIHKYHSNDIMGFCSYVFTIFLLHVVVPSAYVQLLLCLVVCVAFSLSSPISSVVLLFLLMCFSFQLWNQSPLMCHGIVALVVFSSFSL